ncbi:CD79B protein, partial [Heliornis fulica]|nr:CD79B protein [Heliornis fulica]
LLATVSWPFSCLVGVISAEDNSTGNSTGPECPVVQQHPRYVAAKKNMPVHFICYTPDPQSMQWYKMSENSNEHLELDHNTSRYSIERHPNFINLTIFRIKYEDNGIYICNSKNLKVEDKWSHLCGTELRVMGHSSIQQFQSRNTLKDAIIIIQSILLVIFIGVPILLFLDKGEGKESPEEDHTYEGLEVEQMATYEDITPFRDVKAKWTVGEHPGEE